MKKEAFPIYVSGGPESGYHPGMTLREYYAGHALAGILAGGFPPECSETAAQRSRQLADALIAELEGGE